jgi:sulfite reductase alpha subunit-like flavoprotein
MVNLGLGDSNYDRFNGGIQQVEKYLTKLGATKLLPSILADDGIGLELGVEKWRKETMDFLKKWEPTIDTTSPSTPATTPGETETQPSATTTTTPETTPPETTPPETTPPETTPPTKTISDKSEEQSNIIFPTPTLSISPPAGATKPQFLLKQHQSKLSSYLINQQNYNNEIEKVESKFTSNNTYNNILNIKQCDKIPSMYIYEPESNSTTSNITATTTTNNNNNNNNILIGDQLLLQQFIAGTNLHEFLLQNQHSEDAQVKSVYTKLVSKLSELEYGYSNINTLPLFASINSIQLPSETTKEFPEIKTTIDVSLSLSTTTSQVLSQIPISASNNPTVTIENFAPHQQQQEHQIISLYRPGDSVSILCPNTYNSVQSILDSTGLNQYSQHNILLHSNSPASAVLTTNNESTTESSQTTITTNQQQPITIETPLTHLHCQQPSSDLINTIFQTQLNSSTSPSLTTTTTTTTTSSGAEKALVNDIISIGNVLLDLNSGSVVSIIPTLESLLTHSIELNAPIKKALVRSFAEMCKSFPSNPTDSQEPSPIQQYQTCVVELLYQLMSKDGRNKIKQFIEDQSITVLDLLNLFTFGPNNDKVIQPDLNILIELCNSLKPRSYSISSSPHQHMLVSSSSNNNTNNPTVINLSQQDDVNQLSKIILDSNTAKIISGTSFRFAATLTVDSLPLLKPIPKADYQDSHQLPTDCESITSQHYISKQNGNFNGDNQTDSSLRTYGGLCTHWFVQLYHDYQDLLKSQCTTKDELIQFLSTQSQYHSNPRFWGCVLQSPLTKPTPATITILIPFFFHTSPTFHPPTLLTPTTPTTPSPHT